MISRKTFGLLALVFMLMFLFGASGLPARVLAEAIHPGPSAGESARAAQQTSGTDEAIQSAFKNAVSQNNSLILGTLIYDSFVQKVTYSQDGTVALLWIALRDPETGEVIATEPGLSIARNPTLAEPQSAANWSITLQSQTDFADQLRALPPELITDDIRQFYLVGAEQANALTTQAAQVFSGYKLPWTAGLSKKVTNSIGHVVSVSGGLTSCPDTCRYAFDFADGTMFPMIAAKGGTVKALKYTCPNNQSSCTNYLILEDQSTVPTTYQVYYHMSYNTVPNRLRNIGATVTQGEYIGDADNTGYSTGSHLHYHVYTTRTISDWSWGYSVDITFDDVSDNGGRPRTCSEAAAYPSWGSQCQRNNAYTSGNTPANPPAASLDQPGLGQVVTGRTLHVQGSASDDIQVSRIQVLINYDGTWKAAGDIAANTIPAGGSGPYAGDVDLCALNVPDGPFAMTLRVYDREGSQASNIPVRQMLKSYTCASGVTVPQSVNILAPTSKIPVIPFDIYASAVDTDGGAVAKMDFFWHGPDWNQPWVKLGTDTDPSDNWSMGVNPAAYGGAAGSALLVQATSIGGGVKSALVSNLPADDVSPISKLELLPANINTTVFNLSWLAADPQNDIDHFILQYLVNKNDGSEWSGWQTWSDRPLPGDARRTWFNGTAGYSYVFHLQAVDRAGNVEPFDGVWETYTTLGGTCQIDDNETGERQDKSTAIPLKYNDYGPLLNFCKSSAAGAGTGDVDWLSFTPDAGAVPGVMVLPQGGGSAFRVTLYNSAGAQIATWQSSDYETPAIYRMASSSNGLYYIKIEPLQPGMFGTDMRYIVWAGNLYQIFTPLIGRQ